MGWEERMRTAVRAVWRDDVRLGWDDGVRFGDLREALAELRAARAEIERLRTAAADERADVIAKACVLAEYLTRDHMPDDDKHAGHMIYTLAEEFERGAHVGAANGGERG